MRRQARAAPRYAPRHFTGLPSADHAACTCPCVSREHEHPWLPARPPTDLTTLDRKHNSSVGLPSSQLPEIDAARTHTPTRHTIMAERHP